MDEKIEPIEMENSLDKLCNVITDAIKTVGNNNVTQNANTRSHIMTDKDFPIFNGNPEHWPMFMSQLQRLVNVCNYTDDEMMAKLQKCLRGEALEAVKCMMYHPKNVETVLKTLEMRFGRPEFVIETLIAKMKTFPVIKKSAIWRSWSNFLQTLIIWHRRWNYLKLIIIW